MRNSKGQKFARIIALLALALSAVLSIRAQYGNSSSPLDLSALQLVPSNAIPAFGNFYFAGNYGITPGTGLNAFGPPLPGDVRPDLPLYSLGNGNLPLVDNYDDPQAQTQAAQSVGMALRGGFFDDGFRRPDANVQFCDQRPLARGNDGSHE